MKIETIQLQSQALPPLPKDKTEEAQNQVQQTQETPPAITQPSLQTGMNLSFQVKKD